MSESTDSLPTGETPPSVNRSELRRRMGHSLAKGGMKGVQVISLETAKELLTDNRIEIIEYLQTNDPQSIRALARDLDRDKGHVSRDLKELAKHGIVDFETDGRTKRPYLQHEHLVVEPIM